MGSLHERATLANASQCNPFLLMTVTAFNGFTLCNRVPLNVLHCNAWAGLQSMKHMQTHCSTCGHAGSWVLTLFGLHPDICHLCFCMLLVQLHWLLSVDYG